MGSDEGQGGAGPGVDASRADDGSAARLRAIVDPLLDPHMLFDAVRDPYGRIVDLG